MKKLIATIYIILLAIGIFALILYLWVPLIIKVYGLYNILKAIGITIVLLIGFVWSIDILGNNKK